MFFTPRVVGHWNRLPRALVTALSLCDFMKCLDNALGHRVGFLVSVQGQEFKDPDGFFPGAQIPGFYETHTWKRQP